MKRLIFLMIVLFSISFVYAANCPPTIPKTYYGNVFCEGSALSGTPEIRAVIGDGIVGIDNISGAQYSIDVSACSGDTGEIDFIINGIKANENGDYAGMGDWGKSVNLDLTFNTCPPLTTTCSNGVIDLGEECDGVNLAGRKVNACGTGWTGTISCGSDCKIDYSNCELDNPTPTSSPGSPGGGGGSPGGGGSSGSSSTPNENGVIDLTPADNTPEITNTSDKNETISYEGQDAGITGSVIGFVKSGRGIATLTFAILVVVVGIFVIVGKKKK